MTFKTLHSNRVEKLSDSLIAELATHPLQDPLAPEFVLVDNRVLGEWLNLQIAQQQGIATNIRYIQPHELFWLLARRLVSAAIPYETPLSKPEMTWKLYGLLDDKNLLAQEVMQPVRDYLADDANRDLKRYQLASSVADLFDQYLIYRPDWILKWQNKNNAENMKNENEAWQCELFNHLVNETSNKNTNQNVNKWPHRAAIEKKLLNVLHEETTKIKEKIPFSRLSVFGITSMPPNLVHLLSGLGRSVTVNAYILNPCQMYWSLISSARELAKKESHSEFAQDQHYEIGNPLLASQGVQVRDFIGLMQNAGDLDPVFLFDENNTVNSLLESMQQEIRDLEYKGESALSDYVVTGKKKSLPGGDGNTTDIIPSVHIHCCHSVMREVEVLHDQIRDMLARNPDMHPRDIVVMMPRVAPYVACIHAVFNSVEENKRLHYHISDRTQLEESPLLNCFETLLKLPESRFELSRMLSVLEVPAVQRRFGIDAEDFFAIKRWLVDSGVRWGIDAAHRKSFGLPEYSESSWEFGFNRLMAGYAMTADDTSTASIVSFAKGLAVQPYDRIEGSNSASFDALLRFWQSLMDWKNNLTKPATPHAWAERLRELLEIFFEPLDESEVLAIKTVRNHLQMLDQAEERLWYSGELTLKVIRDVIKPSLEQMTSGQNHWREGVKFCSLMPMRGVPFKAVHILGMNREDYPRSIEKRSFDLMYRDHRPGDRASRIDDRWLFLEALLSARRYFHVSYVGRDLYRNEKREPSVVLSELIDYCNHGYDLPKNYLFTEHALQPFSDKYFRQDKSDLSSRLVSFNEEAWRIANAKHRQNTYSSIGEDRWKTSENMSTSVNTEAQVVSLDDFVTFFTKPWNWFFTRKHKVWLDVEEDAVDDEENFSGVDALDRWQLRKDLIAMVNALDEVPEDCEAKRDKLINELAELRAAEGRWPLGNAGENEKQGLQNLKTDYLWTSYEKNIKPVLFKTEIGSGKKRLTIEGELPITEEGCLLLHSPGKNTTDKRLDFYIRLAFSKNLSLKDPGFKEALACFFDDKSGYRKIRIRFMDLAEDNQFLNLLASLYLAYQQTGLPFEPELSTAIANTEDDDDRTVKIDKAWNGDQWNTGIARDSKKRFYFGHIETLKSPDFLSVSEQIGAAIKRIDDVIASNAKAKS